MRGLALLPTVITLVACNPPAADDGSQRIELRDAGTASNEPLPSPDTTNAIWGAGAGRMRLLYGDPGKAPLLGLTCEGAGTDAPLIRIIRYSPADPDAKALFALVGNGSALRVKVDSTWTGKGWRWEGTIEAADPALDVLTGRRGVEATLPGAGSLMLKPSPAPRELVEACRNGVNLGEEEDPFGPDEMFREDHSAD